MTNFIMELLTKLGYIVVVMTWLVRINPSAG